MTGWSRHLLWFCVCCLVLIALGFAFSQPVLIGNVGDSRPIDCDDPHEPLLRAFPPLPCGAWKTGICIDLYDQAFFDGINNEDYFGFRLRAYEVSQSPWFSPAQLTQRAQPIGQILVAIPFGWLLILFGSYPVAYSTCRVRIWMYIKRCVAEPNLGNGEDNPVRLQSGIWTKLVRPLRGLLLIVVALCLFFSTTVCVTMAIYYYKTSGNNNSFYLFRTGTNDPTDSTSFWLRNSLIGDPHLYCQVSRYAQRPSPWAHLLDVIPERFINRVQNEFRHFTDGSYEYVTRFQVKAPVLGCFALSVLYIAACVGWFSAGRRISRTDRCLRCHYNLRGNQSGICPECGLICATKPTKAPCDG